MYSSITSIIKTLSMREKIGQTCQFQGTALNCFTKEQLSRYFQEYPIASLFVGSEIVKPDESAPEKLKNLIADCQMASRLPLSVAGDLENGAGGAVRGLTAFPNMMALGVVDDPMVAYEYGRWTATEARAIGFNWTFGPVVDLSLNWLNPVVNLRSLGSNPARVAELAAALIQGFQENGLSATAKHFPGDGVDFRDQHLCLSVNSLEEKAWRASFGTVYTRCFNAGIHAVMAGHIALPWADRRTGRGARPIPATVSGPILTALLREELGFTGVVVSDALIMAGFTGWAGYEDRVVQAFDAGVDVMLWPGEQYFPVMERAIETGRISEARLNASVQRVLAMKAKQGLVAIDSHPAPRPAARVVPSITSFAHDLAERSLTLARNREKVLPLHPASTRRMLVLLATPRAERGPQRLEPFLRRVRARGIEVQLMVNGNCLDIRQLEEAGGRFDVLLGIFDLWTHGLKNTMRPTGEMAECLWTLQLVETMRPILVSLGSPYLLHDAPWADTCVNAYGADVFTLEALDRALFGEIPMTGVSPVPLGGGWVPEKAECAEL
jgi:beta-N-acetylhexosaminidase